MSLKLFCLIFFINICLLSIDLTKCSSEEERLIKTLFKGYNKLIRPVRNSSDHVVITMDLVLLQLINVYEKDQVMKTNVWINLKWRDFQFDWTAKDFKVGSVRVPPDRVWTPDIVLFNNADGNYEASYKPNVLLYGDVLENETNVMWIPPAIYKSSCTIDVRYFPFDEQLCEMRFGSWTFDAQQVKLKRDKPLVNLEDYLPSGTWDVISVPGFETYSKETNRMELVYQFRIRRKTLFYTVNLIIPTVLISFLSIFVFYLPTDEGEKMTLCISILLALVVFLLLVSKILPPTSMVIPLISKYLIFTLMMNIVTILNTVIIINWNYRTPRTHTMPKWVKCVFVDFFPKILFMKRPKQERSNSNNNGCSAAQSLTSLNKTTSLIEKFNNSQKNLKSSSTRIRTSASPPLASFNKTGHGLDLNLLENNTTTDNQNEEQLLQQQSGAFSCASSSLNHTPILKSKSQETSNSNIDLTASNSLRQKHLQHKQLDKFSNFSAKRAQSYKTLQQQPEGLLKLINRKKSTFENEFNDNESIDLAYDSNRNYSLGAVSSSGSNKNRNFANKQLNRNMNTKNNANNNNSMTSRRRERSCGFKNSKSKSLECGDDQDDSMDENKPIEFSPEIIEAADKVTYITNHIKSENDYEEMRDDWKYVALVIDRIMLYIFFSVTVIGTAFILFDAPHIFEFVDQQAYLDKLISANKF